MRRYLLQLMIPILVCAGSVSAQQKVFEFLRIDKSPRAAALAGSFVAGTGDANVLFYNPAGIMMLDDTPVSFSFLKHLEDINSASFVISRDFEGIGRFAASIDYINYGDFTEADEYGNKLGSFSAGDFALSVAYANKLDENFFYGANIKFIYSGIADYSSTGIGADLGLFYNMPENLWTFGFSILNIGTQLSAYDETNEDFPVDMRLGLSKKLEHMPFRFYASLNKLNEKQDNFADRFGNFTLGGEFFVSKVIRFRVGYDNEKRDELKTGTTSGLAGFNFGLGVVVNKYSFDYALSSLGAIGSLHRVGLTTTF